MRRLFRLRLDLARIPVRLRGLEGLILALTRGVRLAGMLIPMAIRFGLRMGRGTTRTMMDSPPAVRG